MVEFSGLMNHAVFRISENSEAIDSRIYGSRFAYIIENEGKPQEFAKSRLVMQSYHDEDHSLLTYAPIIQRFSRRLLLSLCAMNRHL